MRHKLRTAFFPCNDVLRYAILSRMNETFRDIIDLFPNRADLADQWDAQVRPQRRINVATLNLWHHRDGIPPWSWAGLVACAEHFEVHGVTLARLSAADHESRKRRASQRKKAAAPLKKTKTQQLRSASKDLSASYKRSSKGLKKTNEAAA